MAPELERKIIECVDKGLSSILGNSTKQAASVCLEKRFGVGFSDVYCEPEKFHNALRGIFGEGTGILEGEIVREMKSNLALNIAEENLVEVVREVKRSLVER